MLFILNSPVVLNGLQSLICKPINSNQVNKTLTHKFKIQIYVSRFVR